MPLCRVPAHSVSRANRTGPTARFSRNCFTVPAEFLRECVDLVQQNGHNFAKIDIFVGFEAIPSVNNRLIRDRSGIGQDRSNRV